jgi:hypothetical protein
VGLAHGVKRCMVCRVFMLLAEIRPCVGHVLDAPGMRLALRLVYL